MRCYNGCPDSELQALLDEAASLTRKLKAIEPESHYTYSPEEQKYQAHRWGYPLSGFHSTRIGALQEALRRLV